MEILNEFKRLEGNSNFRVFPSLRFEYFLTLLKEADFIIGNSSAAVREAPFYHVPSIDIGTRQSNRVKLSSVISSDYDKVSILDAINSLSNFSIPDNFSSQFHFGDGNSDKLFKQILDSGKLWAINHQKQFQELN